MWGRDNHSPVHSRLVKNRAAAISMVIQNVSMWVGHMGFKKVLQYASHVYPFYFLYVLQWPHAGKMCRWIGFYSYSTYVQDN